MPGCRKIECGSGGICAEAIAAVNGLRVMGERGLSLPSDHPVGDSNLLRNKPFTGSAPCDECGEEVHYQLGGDVVVLAVLADPAQQNV